MKPHFSLLAHANIWFGFQNLARQLAERIGNSEKSMVKSKANRKVTQTDQGSSCYCEGIHKIRVFCIHRKKNEMFKNSAVVNEEEGDTVRFMRLQGLIHNNIQVSGVN